ncbi:MAG: hypothetical protein K8H88_24145, partial [Sandaracinaceae bacterium]|nr:hypothetical protein [Sandaracinaceae bacterium]
MLAARTNALALPLILLASAGALAQPDGGLPDWVQHDPFASSTSDDPLGVDRADRLEGVAPTTVEDEVAPRVAVQRGEVLHAISGVRETDHAIEVTLDHGLALVRHTLTLSSTARYAAEARYRIPVPENASLAALEVCDARGCQSGAVDGSTGPTHAYDVALASTATGSPLPIAHERGVRDDRGVALWLRAAPVL